MLKHRIARRLSTLFMLVAVLATVASAPASSSATAGPYCFYSVNDSGQCVIVCCNAWACSETSC